MKILITGARGFIGSALARRLINEGKHEIVAFARPTSNMSELRLASNPSFKIQYGDMLGDISGLCEGIDMVVHFAAKTHVDHSIKDATSFIMSNVVGTSRLLEEANRQKVKAFITISTDEVYGQILQGSYDESAPINPRNPYAASKAGADAITLAYHHTYGMWTAVTRTENNYGPYQHSQKAIPTFIKKAMRDDPLPVYGDGKHVRQWLYVDDHVNALCKMIQSYKSLEPGEVWHIAGQQELTNTELANMIIKITGSKSQIEYIEDHDIRPGHDRRYALSCDKMKDRLQWTPAIKIDEGLYKLYKWYTNDEGRQWFNL
jgi:dTDP-glucose 4,6-dehydratase